jgi:flagellar protein FliL
MTKTKDKADAPPKKARKLLTIMVGATALAAAGAAGGVYLSGGVAPDKAEGADAKPEPKIGTVSVKSDRFKADPRKYEVTYIALEQSFTANLADGAGFVQLGLSLATYYDGKVVQNVERQAVPIRSAILMVLSQQDAAVLSTPQGKQLLQRDLTEAINEVLRQKEGFGGIDNVYFTNLVIQ